MKAIYTFLFLSFFQATSTLACPGAGQINLTKDGNVIATLDQYDAAVRVAKGYSIVFVNSINSDVFNSGTSDGPKDDRVHGTWTWICDERLPSERPSCDVKKGVLSIPKEHQGVRHFHIAVRKGKKSEPIVYLVDKANVDPNQPQARDLGSCGSSIPAPGEAPPSVRNTLRAN